MYKNTENSKNNKLILNNDEFLLLKYKDSIIITKIFNCLKKEIYRFIYYRTGGNILETDEIFSDSTEAFLKYLPNIKYNKNLNGLWLKITRGRISEYYRNKKKQVKTLEKIKDDVIINNQVQENDISSVEKVYSVYNAALEAINEKYRKIILLRYRENRTLDEICCILNNNKKYIKNSLYRAKKALTRKMNFFKVKNSYY